MDISRPPDKDSQESQSQDSWIPTTPYRPILPRPQPIYEDRQGNQADWLGLKASSFNQETQATCSDSSDWEALGNAGACMGSFTNAATKLNNSSLMNLIAAYSRTVLTGNDTSSASNWMQSSSTMILENDFLSLGPTPWINGSCTPEKSQYGLPILQQHSYDLNLAPRTVADALSSRNISQFVPITPDKAMGAESKHASDIGNLCAYERTEQERNTHEDRAATAMVETNGLQLNEDVQQPVTDSTFAAISTPMKENHNPDKGGSHGIDLKETPEQKPRRKKHRPKVVTEGKPKRTPRPVTPKPTGSKEKPTGKRKYVRKKGLNKPSTTGPAEVTTVSTEPETLKPKKKSCKRALSFEAEGQPRSESSPGKATCNLNSESQAQDSCTRGVHSKATLQLGQETEVIVENTQAGIACDRGRSMNQILKDYICLPEGQARNTPLPTKSNPPQKEMSAFSTMENNAEGQGQVTAHNEQENSAQVMLKTNTRPGPRSPNDSNSSTSAILTEGEQTKWSKKKNSHAIKQAGTNLIGAQYNTLQAYHTVSWLHYPSTYKKRRTEKRQNSSTSSTSSSVTAAKDVEHLTTSKQNDAEENPFALEANHWISAPQNASRSPSAFRDTGKGGYQNKMQNIEDILALNHPERLTKKRSRGPTQICDLASPTRNRKHNMQPTHPIKQASTDIERQRNGNLHRSHTYIEAETSATLARNKQTKRNTSVSSACSNTNGQLHQRVVVYSHNQCSANWLASSDAIWRRNIFSIDAIVEGLKHLNINGESNKIAYEKQNALVPYNTNQEHNAIVLYKRDGTVVPFEGSFDPIKKRRPRPKVDLDEETSRVWKLLMGNINSEGIDGTDEEKAKWWEEERRVFRGRTDSFIARMHLVQGDRRFSQWKGSVVDSVIGVFLTQNVSDHLSSSAFMSLAAHFPLKTKSNHEPCYEEGTSLVVDEPEVCILDPEDTIAWNGKMSNQSICAQSSMTLHDPRYTEEKVVKGYEISGSSTCVVSSINESECRFLDSSESGLETYHDSRENRSTTHITEAGTACFIGEGGAMCDTLASQNSFLSSMNSVDFSVSQTAERIGSCSESSEAEDLAIGSKFNSLVGSTFMELLQMAGSNMLHEALDHGSGTVSSHENSKDVSIELNGMEYDDKIENMDNLDGTKSSIPMIPSSIYHLQQNHNLGELEVGFLDMYKEETRFDISKNKDENGISVKSALTAESASKATDQTKPTVSVQEAPRSSVESDQSTNNFQGDEYMIIQSQSRLVGDPRTVTESLGQGENNKMQQNQSLPNISGEPQDITGSTVAIDNTKKIAVKTVAPDLNKNSYSITEEFKKMDATNLKLKSRRVGKEIKNDFNWDTLRKQAEANGGKKERSANTMDTLDWEAVRCADVNEIADTIKERGMNNVLAGRMKDFLNRLIREHGDIDLEWLRDVPPDKAKEYLLSIRGLGLKSVECVRLLTLHHLAFPVDTNVGRIAVRLGWVPLQPLPESLQLHLLELYPVLESIQKYLWPRLCKLDQRTLYELHYQMITFGKVFCTKSKPNCNACPMRGECRHFASAFASARLALPGPEDKSIVSATENRTADQNPVMNLNRLPLPPPQANGQSEEHQKLEASKQAEAKSGVSNCEPIIEVPATPEPECTLASENDIEDTFYEDPDEIPMIKLNIEEFTQNLQNYMQENMELQEGELSKALVALTPEATSIPMPKLKNVSRLRTEHHVYELPDSHPLLDGLDKREPDDPCSYLLAIWTPGETANSIQPPEKRCSSQELGKLCAEKTCFSCSSIREANSQMVRGTLLIPCRTAMRGSFPLNGTYFQVNEVFADHDSSLNPIDVPRAWIWNLPRRTVYFGTSIPTIFKGLSTEGIQHCFWRGFVCVRGFDQKMRAPRPLMARLHFPASKLAKTKGRVDDS